MEVCWRCSALEVQAAEWDWQKQKTAKSQSNSVEACAQQWSQKTWGQMLKQTSVANYAALR